MIKGAHAMFYSPKADEVRAFMRDKLEIPFTDAGEGWLVFNLSEGEAAAHPAERQYHEISFYCDDIDKTVAELKERGVEFATDIKEEDWGRVARISLPDGSEVDLYQAKY